MDFILHASVSAISMVLVYSLVSLTTKRLDWSLWSALMFTTMLGVGKEIYDLKSYGLFSAFDILFDFIGICIGFYLCWRILKKKEHIYR